MCIRDRLIALCAIGEDALHDAGHPDGVVEAGLLAAIAHADNARIYELVALLLNKFNALLDVYKRQLLPITSSLRPTVACRGDH